MNISIFRFFLGLVILSQAGCFERTEPRFSPGGDEFVRKLFERGLDNEGIVYKLDDEGFYTSSPKSIDRMQSISEKAFSDASRTSSLEVDSKCALDSLLSQLDNDKVVYIVDRKRKPALVKTTTEDSQKYKVMETYIKAQSVCSP